MTETLPQFIGTKLKNRNFQSKDEMYLFLLSIVAAIFCLFAHVYMTTLFALWQQWSLLYINLFSITVYMLAFFLIAKRKYTLVGIMISLEVSIYAAVMSVTIGIASFTVGYYILIIIMQFIIPFGQAKGRAVLVGVTFLGTAVCLFFDMMLLPLMDLGPLLFRMVAISNILIIFFGTIVELYIGDVVKQVIARVNEEQMQELTSQANTDALTGLFNRRYADLFFNKLPENETPYLVAMIDIDNFKKVNDTYGHGVGDEVLQYLAQFLKERLRKTDLIFRWGGEEFVILLANVDLEVGHKVLDGLRKEVSSRMVETSAQPIPMTVTIGVANLDKKDPMGSVDRSDQKMYQGKTSGKDRVMM